MLGKDERGLETAVITCLDDKLSVEFFIGCEAEKELGLIETLLKSLNDNLRKELKTPSGVFSYAQRQV